MDITEIYDLRVEVEGDERLGLAELRLFGDILGDVLTCREVSPDDLGATRDIVDFSSHFVDVTVAVRWDHNWRIEAVVPTGVAVADANADANAEDHVLWFRAEALN